MIGVWAEKNPDAVKMISEHGHDVANHSYSHFRMGSIDNGKIRTEILKCDSVLEELTGKKVDLFRAPYGDYNNSVIKIARGIKPLYHSMGCGFFGLEAGHQTRRDKEPYIEKCKNGSILLFHNDTPHTAKILPDIITALKDRGYGFIPVSELILRENYEIDHTGRQKEKIEDS